MVAKPAKKNAKPQTKQKAVIQDKTVVRKKAAVKKKSAPKKPPKPTGLAEALRSAHARLRQGEERYDVAGHGARGFPTFCLHGDCRGKDLA